MNVSRAFPLNTPSWWQSLRNRFQNADRSDANIKHSVPLAAGRNDNGFVLLVGAGPGDPDLLTIKGLKALQKADIVLVDWLVSDEIVQLIPKHVEQRFVGKRAGHHSMSQEAINDLMVEQASLGKSVVRLKGGDPAIFGRTGEEAKALQIAGIPHAIIPGITASSGASASTGIPLTQRGCAQSVRVLTAQFKDPLKEPNWRQIVATSEQETLVFYMGLGRLNTIMTRLIENGLDANMPVAVIDKATTLAQQVCTGSAETIANRVNQREFSGPSLIVIGKVVSQRFEVDNALMTQALACVKI
jgi:uroporphyrin-III C-methyltransferase